MTTKKTAKKSTARNTARKLPELTLEDALRQAVTRVAKDEPMLEDLSDKERSILVKEVLDDHGDALEAILRGYVVTMFVDLFVEDEDDEDEDEDDEDEDEDEDDEDEDE